MDKYSRENNMVNVYKKPQFKVSNIQFIQVLELQVFFVLCYFLIHWVFGTDQNVYLGPEIAPQKYLSRLILQVMF